MKYQTINAGDHFGRLETVVDVITVKPLRNGYGR